MKIFIPTYGRHDQQTTYAGIPAALKPHVWLVVQDREKHLYDGYQTMVLPRSIKTIAPTRQYIMEIARRLHYKHIVMMDDDLRFFARREDDKGKFLPITEKQFKTMVKTIDKRLDKYAHVGILAREGGNRVTEPTRTCTRMMRVLGYDVEKFFENEINFDRLPLQSDFDVTLQLLRKGFPNLVLCEYVQDQGSSNAKGGCSHFRTFDMINKNVEKLAKLHAPFVKVTTKQTKTAWNGNERKDVTVQWKKAYESSQV